jgi:GxxExxY protein
MLTENEIASIIINTSFNIHKKLGPGLFESVYESILAYELINTYHLNIKIQQAIPVIWKGQKLDLGFRADLIVEDLVIIELKSVEKLAPVHHKQLITYLKLTDKKLGLLINFNEALLKDGLKRIVNNL